MSGVAGMTLSADGGCVVMRVPIRMKRRRGRKEVLVPEGVAGAGVQEARVNRGLAVMIARAHRWRRVLEDGRYRTIGELAHAVGVDGSYVARMLRLTLLAPDIVEGILEGSEPSGLSIEKLYGMPAGWEAQRREVG